MSQQPQCIFVVDDQPEILKAVIQTLQSLDVNVVPLASAKDCLRRLALQDCDLLITDVKMPELDGLELLRQVKAIKPWLPVLMISGFGDIPMTVQALKLGASDFVEKPLQRAALLASVRTLLEQVNITDSLLRQALSKAERRILPFIVEGYTSKMVADRLHRSVRTIELHRQHIMDKLGVTNTIELVRHIHDMGLGPMAHRAAHNQDQTINYR